MRRFITLMVWTMMLIAIGFSSSTAKAAVPSEAYLFGVVNDKDNWTGSEANMVKMNKIGDNEWEIEMTRTGTSYFRVCIKFSDGGKSYYASQSSSGNQLTGIGNGYYTYNQGGNSDTGNAFEGNLKNRYVQVKYNTGWDQPVYVTVTDEPKYSTAEPTNIWIFGDLGNTQEKYGDQKWATKETDYKLLKASTENGKTIYTGKVTFRNGENWFRFYGGAAESGPGNTTGNQTITLKQAFNVTGNVSQAFYYNNTTGKDEEYDVKLVYNGKQNYSVTISPVVVYPPTLYVYSTTDYNTPFATLTGDGNGRYTAKMETGSDLIKNKSYYIFISSLEAGTGRTEWASHNGKRYTTGRETDRTITTAGSMDLTLTDSGTVEYVTEKEGTATFTFTLNDDVQGGVFNVTFEEHKDYYLSGDINDWVTKDDDIAKLDTYKFARVSADDANLPDEDKSKWYVLYVPRMHGQFKIHTGGWAAGYENWGCIWKRAGAYPYGEMNYTDNRDEIHDYIDNSGVAESLPDAANLGHQISTENISLFNLRCTHNYYNEANLYFNPTENKIFIKGTPEDIYVYYYNGDNPEEANGSAEIFIKENAVNVNTHHYYYDDRILSAQMSFGALTAEERQIPALGNVPDGASCYKGIVPSGLEEKYRSDGMDHYFEFYLQGASKVGESDKDVFSGHNVYYIYSGVLPAVVFDYVDAEGTEVFAPDAGDNVDEICYRLIAIDADGVPEYIKEDGTRTKKRSEAAKYILDYKLTNGTDGFNPGSGTIWHGVTKQSTVQSIMAKEAPAWTSQVETVKPGDVNRYVEFDVKLADPQGETGDVYHEFHSDFVLGATDGDAFVQDGDIDTKAQMTGKLISGRNTDPKYKLNGTNLYAAAQTSVPTAVEDIPVDNEYGKDVEAVYYNLQGVRVINPARGIYIKVKGTTATKVRL